MFRWFVAYKSAFRLITLAALLGVTYSVTVLIVVVSVMEGFRSELQERIRGTTSDIRVESTIFIGLADPERLEKALAEIPGVASTSPIVETLALFRRVPRGETAVNRLLLGLDVENRPTKEELDAYLEAVAPPQGRGGREEFLRWLLAMLPEDVDTLFSEEWLYRDLWKLMRAVPSLRKPDDLRENYLPAILGSEHLRPDLFIFLPGSLFELTSFSPVPPHEPRVQRFFVAGYFKTGLYELDADGIVIRLEDADRFLDLTENDTLRVSAIRVTAEEGYRDEESLIVLRERIEERLAEEDVLFADVQTWKEKRSALLDAVKMEKVIVSIILGAVILFAGFMIFIILSVQVVEKTRDIGVLLSLGSTTRGVATIYFLIGSSLCFLGTILGTVYGVTFATWINTIQRWIKILTGYELFPKDIYYLDRIPVEFDPGDLLLIIIPTVAASLIASIVPALRAARKDPAVTLRAG